MANPNPSPATRFGAGQVNPGRGRQRAARDKVTAALLEALNDSFNEPNGEGGTKGPEAIRKVRDTDPATYVRILAALMPKQLEVEDVRPEALLSDEEIEAMLGLMREELDRRQELQGTGTAAVPFPN